MILPDYLLRKYAEDGAIAPYDPELINPASVDIHIGSKAKLLIPQWQYQIASALGKPVESDKDKNHFVLIDLTEGATFNPNARLLVETLEVFDLPNSVAGRLTLTSSAARRFWQHIHSDHIHPGHKGRLTLELINLSYYPKQLKTGDVLTQVVLHRMEAIPESSYQGKYQNDTTVEVCKP